MWPNPQFPADLVTFAEKILNGKLHFLKKFVMENFIFCAVEVTVFVDKIGEKSSKGGLSNLMWGRLPCPIASYRQGIHVHYAIQKVILTFFYQLIQPILKTSNVEHKVYQKDKWSGMHWLFHDGGPYYIKTSPLICPSNQWTGLYIYIYI